MFNLQKILAVTAMVNDTNAFSLANIGRFFSFTNKFRKKTANKFQIAYKIAAFLWIYSRNNALALAVVALAACEGVMPSVAAINSQMRGM